MKIATHLPQLTRWFFGDEPMRRGVYEIKAHGEVAGVRLWKHWNGKFWGLLSVSIEEAHAHRNERSVVQRNTVWRGLDRECKQATA